MNLEQWRSLTVKQLDQEAKLAAELHQAQLTKPPGSLGMLESLVVDLAAMQGTVFPRCDNVHISIFAADHGVACQGVSAFPQDVTAQMVLNFAQGGAAVAVLAKQMGANFEVINLGTVKPTTHPGIINQIIAEQSGDISQTAAMSDEQLLQGLQAGKQAVDRAIALKSKLFIAGEMGIANTTPATALLASLLELNAEDVTGPGTGVSGSRLEHKASIVAKALTLHQGINDPFELLRCLGGFEIVAMCGAYLRAAEKGLPVLVDGFISSASALLACKVNPEVRKWLLFGHCSAEPFHRKVLQELDVEPILMMGMRLGEGSGAAMAVSILRAACELHSSMATFSDAGVSNSGE